MRVFMIALLALLFSTPESHAEDSIRSVLQAMEEGRSIPNSPKTILFLGGAADWLVSNCEDLDLSLSQRAELGSFIQLAATRAAVGGRYSDPDLGQGIGDQLSGIQVYAAGGALAEQTNCGAAGTRLARMIVNNTRANRETDAGSDFVASCQGQFSGEQCRCLLQVGQAIIPGLESQPYGEMVIPRIIESNPFLGFQIALQCGITDY